MDVDNKSVGGEGRLSLRAVEPGALPGDGGAVLSLPAAGGVFRVPLEKKEMFLTAPEGQASVAPSGLSDEQMRLNTQKTIQPPPSLCEEFSRVGGILTFRDS